MRIYLTKACRICPLKDQCTTANERRIKRWEHEHAGRGRPDTARSEPASQAWQCRKTVEHPFATLKMRMGATHFLMKTLPKVAKTEMALHVLAYNLTRVMNIVGIKTTPGGNPGGRVRAVMRIKKMFRALGRAPSLRPV